MHEPREPERHLVFFERAGDARRAFERAAAGGEEYYHGERRTVELKRELAERFGRATVVTATGSERWDAPLTPHLRAVGLGQPAEGFEAEAFAWLDAHRPTHLIVGPELSVLRWAAGRGVEVLPNFAHTFFNPSGEPNPLVRLRRGLGGRRTARRFARVLRRLDPAMLLNHNEVAAADLRRLAPRPGRVRVMEMMDRSPLERSRPRTLDPAGPHRLFYCGRAASEKGLPDLIAACGMLVREGIDAVLTVCGGGDETTVRGLARRAGMADRLDWRGVSTRSEVAEALEAATVAVVPSRHAYPEGFPLTLLEALGVGLPLVASDHRAWARLRDGEDFAAHRAGDAGSLASSLRRVLTDPALYARLSRNGPAAFERVRCTAMLADLQREWADLVLKPGG